MQDKRGLHLDEITSDHISIFTIVKESVRPYNMRDAVHFAYTYELDLDKYTIERTVYTSLDWLGDVGGLMDILFLIGAYPLMLF